MYKAKRDIKKGEVISSPFSLFEKKEINLSDLGSDDFLTYVTMSNINNNLTFNVGVCHRGLYGSSLELKRNWSDPEPFFVADNADYILEEFIPELESYLNRQSTITGQELVQVFNKVEDLEELSQFLSVLKTAKNLGLI